MRFFFLSVVEHADLNPVQKKYIVIVVGVPEDHKTNVKMVKFVL